MFCRTCFANLQKMGYRGPITLVIYHVIFGHPQLLIFLYNWGEPPRDDVSPLKLPFGGCIRLWDKPVLGIHQYFAIYDVPMMSMGHSNITKSDFHFKCNLFSAWSIFGSPLKKCHQNWWLWLWCCFNNIHLCPNVSYIFFFCCLAGDFPLNESTKIAIQSCPSPSEITLGEGLHVFSGLGAV